MAKNTEIISVSISKEQGEAISRLELSPSALLQEKLNEVIERSKGMDEIKQANDQLKQSLWKATQAFADFLEEKGIDFSEYNQFVFARDKRMENGIN